MIPRRPSVLALILATCMLDAGSASAQALVGYVTSMEGDGAQLLRGDAVPRRLRLGENILAGDTVTARLDAKVLVDTKTGQVDPCNPAPVSPPCRLHFPASSSGLPGAEVAGRVAVMLTWFVAQKRNLLTRSANPPSITIGKGQRQSLAIGQRSVRVAWNDGEPPFDVVMEGPGGRKASIRTDQQEIRLPTVDLLEGAGKIAIVDRQGRRAVLPIFGAKAPPAVGDLSASAVNAQHRALLELGTIAAAGQGEWSLEAFQETHRLGSSPAAVNFERALLSGGKP